MADRDATHACPGPDCDARVPRHQLACRRHWFTLPQEVRNRVNRTWRNRFDDPHEHRQALMEATALLDGMREGDE